MTRSNRLALAPLIVGCSYLALGAGGGPDEFFEHYDGGLFSPPVTVSEPPPRIEAPTNIRAVIILDRHDFRGEPPGNGFSPESTTATARLGSIVLSAAGRSAGAVIDVPDALLRIDGEQT
jgi:hypothetical protein